jgi:hypothetical protein
MPHKVRRKINRIKQKEKAKKKALKKERKQILAYNDYLKPFLKIIQEEYKPDNVSLYRWVHNPFSSDDFKPQIFQDSNPNTPEGLKVPSDDAPKEVILEYTNYFTLSNYTTQEDAVNE